MCVLNGWKEVFFLFSKFKLQVRTMVPLALKEGEGNYIKTQGPRRV